MTTKNGDNMLPKATNRYNSKTERFLELKRAFLRWTTDFWGLELVNCIVAVLLLLAVIILLASCDDKPLPRWSLGITLNAVLSALSALFQWSLMMPVAECVGQLKWLWFTQPKRSLGDFVTFEEASSSHFGPLLLLKISRLVHLVSIGALITLIAPAFPTSIQQAVSYPLRLKPSGIATASRCTGFFEIDEYKGALESTYLINAMKASIYNGLYNSNANLSDIQLSCPSGNCTWPVESSLAICASLADVTPSIIASCSPTNSSCMYSLPSGGILAAKDDFMSLNPTDGHGFASIAFPDTIPILDVFVFLISNKTGSPVLLESSLNLCVQKYNISVTRDQTDTTLVESWHTLNTSQNLVIEVPGDDSKYVLGDYSYNSMAAFLRTIFSGKWVIVNETITYGSDAIEVLVDTLLVAPWDEAAMSIFLEGMAISMTNALRSGSWSEKVNGTAYDLVTYVEVQWLWMILPISLVLLTLIFLLATMVRSKSTKLWKTSSLATMQGLSNTLHDKLGSLEAATGMEERAEKVFVQLKQEGDGWRLVECI